MQTLDFLSIGDRGVGKTVFLLASYAVLHSKATTAPQHSVYLDFQNSQDRDNIESLLKRIAQTGQYPPPTLKMTDFSFDVKSQGWRGEKTLHTLRWWDVPGESCQSSDPQFQSVLLKSHGCCIFLDAYALMQNPQYLTHLGSITKRAEAIASLAQRHQLHYPMALILTKCDRIGSGPLGLLKLEETLNPLIKSLEGFKANYRCFYMSAPVVAFQEPTLLASQGVAAPLLWLMSEAKAHNNNLETSLEGVLSNQDVSKSTQRLNPSLRPRLLVGLGSLAIIAGLFVGGRALFPSGTPLSSDPSLRPYQETLQRDPNNVEALSQLAATYEGRQQYRQSIPLREQLAQQEPENVDRWLELAGLYLITNQLKKEEAVYNKILDQVPDNVLALTGKADLLFKRGDMEAAKTLFTQAEQSASTDELKAQVRKMAADRLQSVTGGAEK
ncbi:MAG: tetratricopeptide repeat protein [Thermosynechococcaceae cyanobacterium]